MRRRASELLAVMEPAGKIERLRRLRAVEALELAAVLLRELPHLGNHYPFRAFVQKSEKALRVGE